MTGILFPTPFLGWNPVYKGIPRFLGFAAQNVVAGGQYETSLNYRISGKGIEYLDRPLKGDITDYKRSGPGENGALLIQKAVEFDGKLYAAGTRFINRNVDGSYSSEGILFVSEDGREWNKVTTGFESSGAGARGFNHMVATATKLGIRAIENTFIETTDGTSFTQRGAPDLGANVVRGLAGHDDYGWIIFGDGGQIKTAPMGSSTWTSRTSQFGTSGILAMIAGNVFCAVGQAGKISTAPLNAPTTWTARTSGASPNLNGIWHYGGQFWCHGAAGSDRVWLNSADGTTWTKPANRPNVDRSVRDLVFDGTTYTAYLANGWLARGDSGAPWEIHDSGETKLWDSTFLTFLCRA